MKVNIETIPHAEQRYDTCGDWWWEEGSVLQIRVSSLGDTFMEQLIAFHEYAEALQCAKVGIKEEDVTAFDKNFEEARKMLPLHLGNAEPGNSPDAPYKIPHQVATSLERNLANALGIDWNKYEKAVNNLSK